VSAPYREDTAQLLPYTLGQGASLMATHASWAQPVALELVSGVLTFDEQRAPRCVLSVTVHVPEDQAVLDRLDPRTGVRLYLTAGYLRPDGADLQPVADVLLTDRVVDRPSNTMTLTAQGDEASVLSTRPPAAYAAPPDVTSAIMETLTRALGYVPQLVENTLPATSMVVAQVLETQDYWTQVDDWCDRANADVWNDGLRGWHLTPRPVLGTPRASLAVGPRGTLTGSSTVLTRTGWYNAVQLRYTWQTVTYQTITHEKDGKLYNESQQDASALSIADRNLSDRQAELQSAIARGSTSAEAVARIRVGQAQTARDAASSKFNDSFATYNASGTSVIAVTEDHSLVGTAVAQGAYAPDVAGGRVTYSEDREAATTQAAADVAASSILARMLALGRSLELEGIAHYWLRPGHTVAAQLLSGGEELCLASAVSFDLTAGRMRVRTRRPDNDTTILRGG